MNDDIHISILRCVLDKGPIAISGIAKELGTGIEALAWVSEEADTGGKCLWRQGRNDDGEWLHVVSMAGRQILLDHDLLEHARRSSRQATLIAILALIVSIATVLVPIITVVAD